MQSTAPTPDAYIESLPEDRKPVIEKLREVILENLPDGFKEEMNYGMIGYVVPKSIYPAGYHCDTQMPLPFLNIASQKQHVAVYHMGIYADPNLVQWFKEAYAERVKTKLDMGKSCIRFKNPAHIPYDLIGELASRMSPQ
ncbi:MAG TPA: DUF1801 domain-containing protein, partial [Rhodothermales bacterium]|nr:DUF1801 domain-containing protein [Rhodothermales bacterium]